MRLGHACFVVAALVHVAGVAAVLHQIPRSGQAPKPLPAVFRLFNDAVHRQGPGADFFALYHAGVELERHGDIYSPGPDGVTPYFYPYRYLPIFAETAGRLARRVDPWFAYAIWVLALEALLVVNLFLTRRLLGPDPLLPWVGVVWLLYSPLLLEIYMGQFTFLTATFLLATGVALVHGRPRLALLAWLVASAVKMFPLLLLPSWWRRRLLVPALAVVGGLALLNMPSLVHHPGWWDAFVFQNVGIAPFNAFHSGNFGLVYLLRLVGWQGLELDPTLWFPYVSRFQEIVVSLAVVMVLVSRRPPVLAAMSLLLLSHVLSYFHVWEHHYVLLLPLGMFLLYVARNRPRARVLTVAALVALALPTPFVLWDIPDRGLWDPTLGWPLVERLSLPAVKVVPALLLAVQAAWLCLEHGLTWPWRPTPEAG